MTNQSFKSIPIFRIGSVEEAKKFYCEYLGFEVQWEHYYETGAPVYMQLSLNGMELQLSENERFQSGNAIFIETAGIKEFHSKLMSSRSRFAPPELTVSPWNTRQLEFEDPFGNLLRFHQQLD